MINQEQQLKQIIESSKNKQKTKIIAISSGKGGVGKTNFAVNLAIAYSKLGKKTIVMDADLGLANVNVILGVIPKFNLYHVIKNKKTMKEIVLDTPYGIKIIAGASGFSQLANLSDEQRDAFIQSLSELETADIIIIDTGAGVSNNVLSFILAADETIIITTPETTSITDAYGIIKSIYSLEKDIPIKLVINKCSSIMEGKKVADRIINISFQFLSIKVENLGYIMQDEIVEKAVRVQKPFYTLNPKSKASICIDHIISQLEHINAVEGKGVVSFMKRYLKYT
ncbi:MAG TPA: MinD/ParA family protein [Exilispira sp.]|nr:MinD/ParA family protein [Spirochaetota bacterium]HNV43424.1 MinD/ParA family protein [Exilispira sp.]HOV46372.1 MinD/ParA family protein [Exilispira sp.]HQQ19093.1 MinD/ParA family protein [Exilispira sp.]